MTTTSENTSDPIDDLDVLLREASAPDASEALKRRILADHERIAPSAQRAGAGHGLLHWFKQFGLAPTGALAGLGALGFVVGMSTAVNSAAFAAQDEALYFAADTLNYVLVDDSEEALWAAD